MHETDYLNVLRALEELPFNVGKNLLADFLVGDRENDTIEKHRLYKLKSFGSLAFSEEELMAMIDNLIINDLIRHSALSQNKFWKVLSLTEAGKEEIENPRLYKRKLSFSFKEVKTEITGKDRESFKALDFFLNGLNDEQKKAVISPSSKILCIAGAGSGKTAVLTKRAEFLVKLKSIAPEKVLLITFTRKARHEMAERVKNTLGKDVHIETFNSFCEKILQIHNDIAYGKKVSVISYAEKIRLVRRALQSMNTDVEKAIGAYFSASQKRIKTPDQLALTFINDCFEIRDYFKSKGLDLSELLKKTRNRDRKLDFFTGGLDSVDMVYNVCRFIESQMDQHGLRDYTDQLLDTIRLFKSHTEIMPKYEHILIDEYQDINQTQIDLVELLNPENMFTVGDPRQSIFGWRGSDIRHILQFEQKYPDCEIITLTKNYRSTSHIVDLMNAAIKDMKLPSLAAVNEGNKEIRLLKFENEQAENEFIMQRVENSNEKAFILARTNKQLSVLSESMIKRNLPHSIRNEFDSSHEEARVTLATIHAIKGMEADTVFLIGCTNSNFPCRGSEHPIIELLDENDYDKEEEEKRIFYVAISRPKAALYLTYSGKGISPFINDGMKAMLEEKKTAKTGAKATSAESILSKDATRPKPKQGSMFEKLKNWRYQVSKEEGIPPYMIMHDRTLLELCERMPISKEELSEIRGIGPAKIRRYGSGLLNVLHS